MNAAATVAGTAAAVGGAGTWISVDGWPAAVAIVGAIIVVIAFLLCVLASDARTSRVVSVIAALRFQRR